MKTLATLLAVFMLSLMMGNVKAQQGKSSAPIADSVKINAIIDLVQHADTINYDRVFTIVEKEAQFPGGIGTWRKFLERNLDPFAPIKDQLKPGT